MSLPNFSLLPGIMLVVALAFLAMGVIPLALILGIIGGALLLKDMIESLKK